MILHRDLQMPIWMYCQWNSKLYHGIAFEVLCHKTGVFRSCEKVKGKTFENRKDTNQILLVCCWKPNLNFASMF